MGAGAGGALHGARWPAGCVALLRDQRWEVITQEDEDRVRTLLREHANGPCRRGALAPATAVPEMPLSDDVRFVLLAPQVLRQAGWRSEPFLGVKLQDPTWTRARWEQAQARQQGSGLEPLAAPWACGEDTEDAADE